jgi:hypothetical protein
MSAVVDESVVFFVVKLRIILLSEVALLNVLDQGGDAITKRFCNPAYASSSTASAITAAALYDDE